MTYFNYPSSFLIFIILFISTTHSFGEDKPAQKDQNIWTVGIGLEPNIRSWDLVSDDMKNSSGYAIWLSYIWGEYSRVDFTYDFQDFSEESQDYNGLSLAYGFEFFRKTHLKTFALLGAGFGRANYFPKATIAHQQTPHLFARVGMDELISFDQWRLGLQLDYFLIKTENRVPSQVQLGVPLITLSYQFPEEKTPPPQPVALDSDHDGVPDADDQCPGTPEGVKVNSIGCPIGTEVRKELSIEFEPGKSIIKEKYYSNLKDFAAFLKKNNDLSLTIEGHTDIVGSWSTNMKLSQQRADAVRMALINSGGIAPNRLKAVGYGPNQPVDSNYTNEGRQKNRRVMAVLHTE